MNIKQFANERRLKLRLDDCGDPVINGKFGHLYEYDDNELALCFMPGKDTAHLWKARRATCVNAGMTLRQNGDVEGCLSFDPRDKAQAKLAIQVVRCRVRRVATPEQIARLNQIRPKVGKRAEI